MVFDIQRFSTHDGPGIRTVVFFKGCTLRCAWCANPESQSFEAEILYNSHLCINCRACLDPAFDGALIAREGGGVHLDRRRKTGSGPVDACPSLALRRAGREMSAAAIVEEVLRDAAFFSKSGGGATLSGGEPLAHPGLALEVSRLLIENGVPVAIETCLAVGSEVLVPFLALPILWLADLKHVDPARFTAGTGGELGPVLANLGRLAASGAELVLRVPVVPLFNADDASMKALFEFAASLPWPDGTRRRLDLLPYHELALGKYAMLDRKYTWREGGVVEKRDHARWASLGASLGLDVSTGG